MFPWHPGTIIDTSTESHRASQSLSNNPEADAVEPPSTASKRGSESSSASFGHMPAVVNTCDLLRRR